VKRICVPWTNGAEVDRNLEIRISRYSGNGPQSVNTENKEMCEVLVTSALGFNFDAQCNRNFDQQRA
jgi:hypothetical protein